MELDLLYVTIIAIKYCWLQHKKMTKTITLLFVLFVFFNSCQAQTEEEKVERAVENALDEFFHSSSPDGEFNKIDLHKHLSDSGKTEDGLKTGKWIEYSVDSSLLDNSIYTVGNQNRITNFNAIIQKEEGSYLRGKRNGAWIRFHDLADESYFHWYRVAVINYKAGKKHGEEVRYIGYGEKDQKPLVIRNWKEGVEHGIGKIYNVEYPYSLQQVYDAIDGELWILEKYYPNGQLQIKYTDKYLNGDKIKLYQSFFESGQLKQTGSYVNGNVKDGEWISYYENGKTESVENYKNDLIEGNYQYFHDNGQLWTERIYKQGKLWNVISNFSRGGKRLDKGTIKDGNGTVRIYNGEGILSKKVEFTDGKEKD